MHCGLSIICGAPLFVNFMDCFKPWNKEFTIDVSSYLCSYCILNFMNLRYLENVFFSQPTKFGTHKYTNISEFIVCSLIENPPWMCKGLCARLECSRSWTGSPVGFYLRTRRTTKNLWIDICICSSKHAALRQVDL